MPFTHNYPHLGNTTRQRIPITVAPYVSHMILEFDRIAAHSGIERVGHIADKIIEGLQSVDTH